eukprot:maker-scaffold_2-augustus-gene-5.1-mRNA-1 protein AED:0.14 eAED:0.14 QI:291/1/1/1/0.5/0.33/3/177/263
MSSVSPKNMSTTPPPIDAYLATKKVDVTNFTFEGYLEYIKLWTDHVLTGKLLVYFLMFVYYTSGEEGHSVAQFLPKVLLYRLAVIYSLKAISAQLTSSETNLVKQAGTAFQKFEETVARFLDLPGADVAKLLLTGVFDLIKAKIATALEKIKEAETDFQSFKIVGGHLLGAWILFSIFSVRVLGNLYVLYFLIVPGLYAKQKDKIDPILEKIKVALKPITEKVEAKGKEVFELVKAKAGEIQAKVQSKASEMKNKVEPGKKSN